MSKPSDSAHKIVAQNRKARHDFFIEETYEAGLMLNGPEVKSLRAGKASLVDCYAVDINGEMFLINSYIPAYEKAMFKTDERRPRKLLLHRKEMSKLSGRITTKGYTLVALSIYFNARGIAKCELGLAKGKAKHDKREASKERDWNREKLRVMKENK